MGVLWNYFVESRRLLWSIICHGDCIAMELGGLNEICMQRDEVINGLRMAHKFITFLLRWFPLYHFVSYSTILTIKNFHHNLITGNKFRYSKLTSVLERQWISPLSAGAVSYGRQFVYHNAFLSWHGTARQNLMSRLKQSNRVKTSVILLQFYLGLKLKSANWYHLYIFWTVTRF